MSNVSPSTFTSLLAIQTHLKNLLYGRIYLCEPLTPESLSSPGDDSDDKELVITVCTAWKVEVEAALAEIRSIISMIRLQSK